MSFERLTTLAVVGAALLDLWALSRAVLRERGVERTLAWIFGILAFPGVGALAYFAFASPSIRRARRRKTITATAARAAMRRLSGEGAELPSTATTLLTAAATTTGLQPSGGNRVELLAESESAFERMEGALRDAKKRIWSEYYIVKNDATGHGFLDILTRKAREGLEVFLLYDAVGSMGLDPARLLALHEAGGKSVCFLPLNPLRKRWSLHLRNHRKLILIDDSLAFTGGMNVGDEYAGRARRGGKRNFHDTHLELEGPAVGALAQVFAEDWAYATDSPLEVTVTTQAVSGSSALVAPLPSGPDQSINATWLLYFSAIAGAHRRVWLTSPYFIPDEVLEMALISAAYRGVDVRILVPDRSDVRLTTAAGRAYCRVMVRSGVRVYRYLPSMLHAKTLLVDDDIAIVGSANADMRSFRLNFELGALIHDRGFAIELEKKFRADILESREMTRAMATRTTLLPRLRDNLVRLLSAFL